MKIKDIITETDHHADLKKIPKSQAAALKGAVSVPGISQNKSNGNPYQQYRFGLALAVADGKEGGKMEPAGAFAGDPLLALYSDEEFNMVKDAAKMSDAGEIRRLNSMRSEEADWVHKTSPVPARKKNKYGV
jgi:hypothetical protein